MAFLRCALVEEVAVCAPCLQRRRSYRLLEEAERRLVRESLVLLQGLGAEGDVHAGPLGLFPKYLFTYRKSRAKRSAKALPLHAKAMPVPA
jgi:hypothetical protein